MLRPTHTFLIYDLIHRYPYDLNTPSGLEYALMNNFYFSNAYIKREWCLVAILSILHCIWSSNSV
jgi:hypothetical protein